MLSDASVLIVDRLRNKIRVVSGWWRGGIANEVRLLLVHLLLEVLSRQRLRGLRIGNGLLRGKLGLNSRRLLLSMLLLGRRLLATLMGLLKVHLFIWPRLRGLAINRGRESRLIVLLLALDRRLLRGSAEIMALCESRLDGIKLLYRCMVLLPAWLRHHMRLRKLLDG